MRRDTLDDARNVRLHDGGPKAHDDVEPFHLPRCFLIGSRQLHFLHRASADRAARNSRANMTLSGSCLNGHGADQPYAACGINRSPGRSFW